MVATGKRVISSGAQYEKFFALSDLKGTDPMLLDNGTNYDTLQRIDKIVSQTLPQTKAIAAHLKGRNTAESLRNLWSFLYKNVQYREDDPSIEQLRTPLRTWKDRKSGVDCDCYTIFIKSVLKHWGIPNASRMAGYKGGDFQHVYVVVPKDGKQSSLATRSQYYVVDPVVDQFDYEVPFTKKFDRFMNINSKLNGLAAYGLGSIPLGYCSPEAPAGEDLRVTYIERSGQIVTEKFLSENNIPFTRTVTPSKTNHYTLETPAGSMTIGPVLAKEEAQAVQLAYLNAHAQPSPSADIATKAEAKPWFWVVFGAIVGAIAFAPNKKSIGVAGVPSPKATKVIHV